MATVPVDGRLTSFSLFSGPFDGSELFYIVAPGNAAQGNSFGVTADTVAAFMAAFPALNTTIITSGATLATPYPALPGDTKILFNKTLGSASYTMMPSSNTYGQTVLIKDIKGDAFTNNITIQFPVGVTCDGQSALSINSNFGWIEITPIPSPGSNWYQSG
jgi:hypothetical protein